MWPIVYNAGHKLTAGSMSGL